jgi:hypothetical protein
MYCRATTQGTHVINDCDYISLVLALASGFSGQSVLLAWASFLGLPVIRFFGSSLLSVGQWHGRVSFPATK